MQLQGCLWCWKLQPSFGFLGQTSLLNNIKFLLLTRRTSFWIWLFLFSFQLFDFFCQSQWTQKSLYPLPLALAFFFLLPSFLLFRFFSLLGFTFKSKPSCIFLILLVPKKTYLTLESPFRMIALLSSTSNQ